MRMVFAFEPTPAGSRVSTTTYFNTADELAKLLEMGMEEGHDARPWGRWTRARRPAHRSPPTCRR